MTYTIKICFMTSNRSSTEPMILRACSLVGAGAGSGWLMLIFYERKILLADWFGLAETNKRTGCTSQSVHTSNTPYGYGSLAHLVPCQPEPVTGPFKADP